MSKSNQHSKVTLEDLLRLKRAERPGPEFWANFEKELRQKQLTALVHKRRWWHELPVLLNRRVYIPAGAVAVAAFTLVTVRYSVATRIAQVTNSAPQITAAGPAVEVLSTNEVTDAAQGQRGHEQTVARAPEVVAANEVVGTAFAKSLPREAEASAVGSLVANLSRLEQPQSELMDSSLGSRLSAPARVQAAAASQSEVTAIAQPSAGRYQLIARYAERSLSPAPAAPAVVRERLARRLGDDLGDSISRIGVVGSRVSLKF